MLQGIPVEVVREYILPHLDRLSVVALSCVNRELRSICAPLLPAFGPFREAPSLECVEYALRHRLSTHERIFVQLCSAGASQQLLAVTPRLQLDPLTLEQGLLRAVAVPSSDILAVGMATWWRSVQIPVNVLCHTRTLSSAELLWPLLEDDHYRYGDGHVLREAIAKNLPAMFKWCIAKHSYGQVMSDVEWYVDEVHWPVWQMLRAAVEPPNTAESTLFFYRMLREHVYVYSRNELFARVQQHFVPVVDMLATAKRANVLWWLHASANVITARELVELGHRYRMANLLERVFWRYPQITAPSPMQLRLAPVEVRWVCAQQLRRLKGFQSVPSPADAADRSQPRGHRSP